jgi:uncharacterized protein (TIGR04255 family)
MPESAHPAYKEPVIQEAVLHAVFSTNSPPDQAFTTVAHRLADRFPSFLPAFVVLAIPPPVGGLLTPAVQQQTQTVPAMRYFSNSGAFAVTLTAQSIGVHAFPTYSGWTSFRERASFVLNHAFGEIKPDGVSSLNVRYINAIRRTRHDERIGQWLVTTPYVPAAILDPIPVANSRIQAQVAGEHDTATVIVTFATSAALPNREPMPAPYGVLAFDIERMRQFSPGSPPGVEALLAQADELHEDVWNIFAAAKGERLENLMKGEL